MRAINSVHVTFSYDAATRDGAVLIIHKYLFNNVIFFICFCTILEQQKKQQNLVFCFFDIASLYIFFHYEESLLLT